MFRLLKINRLIQRPKSLAEIVREDDLVYTAADIAEILKMIDEGNKTSGGLVKICSAYGIVGFVRFLDCFYLTLITQRKEVGCIAGSFVYSIKATEMFPVRPRDEPETNAFRSLWKKLNKKLSQSSVEIAENRYMGLFQFIDMTKDFFFSYTYDLTRSLQYNYMHAAANKSINKQNPVNAQEQIATAPQDIFQWNHYQIHGTCLSQPLPLVQYHDRAHHVRGLPLFLYFSVLLTLSSWPSSHRAAGDSGPRGVQPLDPAAHPRLLPAGEYNVMLLQ